jgi:hypothetical protein
VVAVVIMRSTSCAVWRETPHPVRRHLVCANHPDTATATTIIANRCGGKIMAAA